MSFKYYIILLIVWVCFSFPSDTFGQYILKDTITSSKDKKYAIIYSDGLAKSAQWSLGVKMAKGGATIRHQVSKETTEILVSMTGYQCVSSLLPQT